LTQPGRVDDASPGAAYDKLDWHFDSAVSAGQPPENAFTHIGFYLAWLIRRDLHDPRAFPSQHIDALKRGEMTGSDLADDIDTKLVSQVMSAEGRAFSDARYATYTSEYSDLFKEQPDYGIVDNSANYARVESLLDRMYAAWVAQGRPDLLPESDDLLLVSVPTTTSVMVPPGFSEERLHELLSHWQPGEVTVLPPWTEQQASHFASDLEALIPRDLTSPPMVVSSVRATEWASSLLNRALKRLEVRPKDAVVVNAIGGSGEQTLTVSIYRVPNVPAERLASEFQSVVSLPRGSRWQRRVVGGREVNWASGREFAVGYWVRDSMVLHVAGEASTVERAITRLS